MLRSAALRWAGFSRNRFFSKKPLQVFESKFPQLRDDFVQHISKFAPLPVAADRLHKMLDFNCVGGKMTRGVTVMTATQQICHKANIQHDELAEKAIVLGWCIEALQAFFLVADDLMDKSETRRGRPCWYKLPDVGFDAVNDSLLLDSFIYFLLQHYFDGGNNTPASPTLYLQLTNLFQDVSLRTKVGQMLDLMSQPQGRKGPELLKQFTWERYKLIVELKTSYYSFYLPLACALLVTGHNQPQQLQLTKKIALQLGQKFQIQDDYLDCFGDPQHIGKIGTDIYDHKCSWLVVQALMRANPAQLQTLQDNYGKDLGGPCEARIKQLYRELELPALYQQQERQSFDECVASIENVPDDIPKSIFQDLLDKIHDRKK
eukprot:TRINITY_DN13473_c0_g1_i1.p1 TRINITY_DN13473_c0_g1~~TRINITY_DN13473_c0_g1_i1.p1  ORF type:complete len:375 (+),score=93.04 TRINITY_DN13473_c0_g1_i1:69-1193(+)